MAASLAGRESWQPSEDDQLLLQAVLLPGRPGQNAWRDWSARVALDDAGAAAYPFLPELYQVLLAAGIDTPNLARLKGISRKTWYENQLRRAGLAALIQILSGAGVRTLLLRGAKPAAQQSANHRLLNASDLACAVPIGEVPAALAALARAGWRPALAGTVPQRHWRYRASMAFCGPAGQPAIELVWRLTVNDRASRAENHLWQRSQPIAIAGQATRAAAPTDQLWLAGLTAAVWRAQADWRWAVDAVRLIHSGLIDWPGLVDTSQACQTICSLRDTLGYLAQTLAAPVPAAVLQQLNSLTPTPTEARWYRLTSQRQGRLGLAHKHWRQYCFWADGQPSLAGFIRYLEAQWSVASGRQALLEAGRRGIARTPSGSPL